MTQQEKRIKIAEWIGINVAPCTCTADPWKDAATGRHLPDYFTDLNAIHEACKKLGKNERNRYLNILHEMCLIEDNDAVDTDFAWCCAEAEQRAESLGLTLKLWE